MFFQHNTCSHQSRIDLLFDKSDLKLHEVLEHVEVLQEAKNKNKPLLKYLTSNEVLSELIGIIITEPPENLSDDVRFKLPHIASELFNCDIPEINELLSSNTLLLEHLYSFIEQDSPLNPLLSSFFSKAFGALMKRSNGQNWYEYQVSSINFYNFLKEKDFINHLLKHIGTSAISDLVIKLITSAEEGVKMNILKWLDEQDLIGSIINLLDPSHDVDTHENACFLLIEILKASKENQANQSFVDPILASLESPATVEALLKRILNSGKSESIIINGVSVFLALLDQSSFGGYKTSDDVRETIIEALVPAIPSFTSLLLDPPPKPTLQTTAGPLEPPLGPTRLSVAKLIAVLLSSNNTNLNKEIAESKTLDILLDLFFKYSLNNFLQHQVVACVLNIFDRNAKNKASKLLDMFPSHNDIIFNNYEQKEAIVEPESEDEEVEVLDPLVVHLYMDCHLVERILEAWEENSSEESRPGFHRKGYMAHLTKIAYIMSCSQKLIPEQIKKLPAATLSSWEEFVNKDLAEINEKNTINLQNSVLADLNDQRQFENETTFKNMLNLETGSDDNENIIDVSDLKNVDCLALMRGDDSSARSMEDDLEDDDEDMMKDDENENDWENADSQIAIDSGNPWENIDNQDEGIGSSNTHFWASFNDFGASNVMVDVFSSKVFNVAENEDPEKKEAETKKTEDAQNEQKKSKDSEEPSEESKDSPPVKVEDSKASPSHTESNSPLEETKES